MSPVIIGAVFVLFLFPSIVSAALRISEIMYDFEGADADREWVEVWNDGATTVDLSGYRFREANTNHNLTLVSGSATLPPNGYAVIADDASRFITDHPGFSGVLFDSSFSLSNTGETLTLKDATLVDLDTVTYSSAVGGNGDGNSLQLSSGAFVAVLPTPGAPLSTGGSQSGSSSSSDASSQTPSSTPAESPPPASTAQSVQKVSVEQQIFPDAGPDKVAVVGADTYFAGSALGLNKKPLERPRFLWNFGDGGTKEGQNVLHVYRYPGDYVVMLDVSSGAYSNGDRALVKAVSAPVVIGAVATGTSGFVEIRNDSPYELDLSLWQVESRGGLFVLPQRSVVLAKKGIRLAPETLGFSVAEGETVRLLYPSGLFAHAFTAPLVPAISESLAIKTSPVEPKAVQKIVAPAPSVPSEVSEAFKDEATTSPIAAVVSAPRGSGMFTWLAALGGIMFFASAALIAVRRMRRPEDEFTLVD